MAFACSAVGRTIRGMARNGFHAPLPLDRVHQGDCLELLARLPDGAAQLAFADPPFNIGYDYDAYDDDR